MGILAMTDSQDKIVSCYNTRYLLDYMQKCGVNLSEYFATGNDLPHIFLTNDRWVSIEQWINLVEFLRKRLDKSVELIGYESIIYNYSKDTTFRVRLFVDNSIDTIKKLASQMFSNYINKNIIFEMDIEPNELLVRFKYPNKEQYHKYFCWYNIGAVRAVCSLRKLAADVTHKHCIENGDAYCEYRVSARIAKEVPHPTSVPISEEDLDMLFNREDQWQL
jgi:hypothetical protein